MVRSDIKPLTPNFLEVVGAAFDKATDTFDLAYTAFSCRDVLMAGLAMFFFKEPSTLAFDEQARGDDLERTTCTKLTHRTGETESATPSR